MANTVKILSIEKLTHDVLQLRFEKPEGYTYELGQAADIGIDNDKWRETLSCFTFTSLPGDDYLEFVIKTYPERNRVTNQLLSVKAGDELILHDPFGDIRYKGEGVFLAGGAGITPFLVIFRKLKKDGKIANNKLIFANKTAADIILRDELEATLQANFINILSDEKTDGYEHGFISKELIQKYSDNTTNYYYLCGPKPMMKAVEGHLEDLGVAPDAIVKEGF